MPDVRDCSDGYVAPPQKGPNPFTVVDPNVVKSRHFPAALSR